MDIDTGQDYRIKNSKLCEKLNSFSYKRLDRKFMELEEMLINETNCPDSNKQDLKNTLNVFKNQFKTRWSASNRDNKKFFEKNGPWLNNHCVFKKFSKSISPGRPQKEFDKCNQRSKRRKTEELRATTSTEELLFSATMKLRSEGESAKSTKIKNIMDNNYNVDISSSHIISPQAALSMLIEAKLSKKQYNVVRSYAPQIFPAYKIVQKEKNTKCYPNNTEVTETVAKVPLQNLLDHTTERLVEVQSDVLRLIPETSLTMTWKWGCDGSSGHSQYMQKFSTASSDDKFVFLTCAVPLKMTASESKIVWHNPSPASPRYCRPIRIEFKKESDELVLNIKEEIDTEINQLVPTKVTVDDREFNVKHSLLFTMIDGKICNTLTANKSAMRCLLCNETSKNFNKIDEMLNLPIVNELGLSFGLSVLHCWIKFFECCLHISYKLSTQEWRQNKESKKVIDDRKREIQREFRMRTGLLIDLPKAGYGNTNVGNSARRFFANPQMASEITGLDQSLLTRFAIILKTIASGFNINTELFKKYCVDTAHLYTRLYPWYNMPTTVHKVLIHGHSIISRAVMPIGHLSEEALEARNKDFKKCREFNARKTSRVNTLTDIFNFFLISSDPAISSMRVVRKCKRPALPAEVIEMILPN